MDNELESVGIAVQREGKVKELADSLEMSYSLRALVNDPNQVLFDWTKEMKNNHYSNIRLHLVHHLATIGMDDIAYRYVYRILVY